MKTRVCRLYGQHDIRIETDEAPAPGPGEVLLRMHSGGICGSDLHYFQDGGFGPIRVREPIILGHEVSGTVAALGTDTGALQIGQKIAFNPSLACGHCSWCEAGLPRHCETMRFSGSAMRMPHEQGGFREYMVAPISQCVALSADTSLAHAACAEPLSVALHACNQAGDVQGKTVLVTGAGPIGSLCVAAARHAGAARIVVTDIQDTTLQAAEAMGADTVLNVSRQADALQPWQAGKGQFDVVFECSAAAPALHDALLATRPGGIIVQVGVTGQQTLALNLLVSKEITLRGTHRFDHEFEQAAALIDSGQIDVSPILTGRYPIDEALAAFEAAADRSRSVKVQLALS